MSRAQRPRSPSSDLSQTAGGMSLFGRGLLRRLSSGLVSLGSPPPKRPAEAETDKVDLVRSPLLKRQRLGSRPQRESLTPPPLLPSHSQRRRAANRTEVPDSAENSPTVQAFRPAVSQQEDDAASQLTDDDDDGDAAIPSSYRAQSPELSSPANPSAGQDAVAREGGQGEEDDEDDGTPAQQDKSSARPIQDQDQEEEETVQEREGSADSDSPAAVITNRENDACRVIVGYELSDRHFSILRIDGHRPSSHDIEHAFDLRVVWAAAGPTWEPERVIQAQAPYTVYAYWASLPGGRMAVDKGYNRVFSILDHRPPPFSAPKKKKKKFERRRDNNNPTAQAHEGGERAETEKFNYLVQWEGYSTEKEMTTWESGEKVYDIARLEVEAYWDAVSARSGVSEIDVAANGFAPAEAPAAVEAPAPAATPAPIPAPIPAPAQKKAGPAEKKKAVAKRARR